MKKTISIYLDADLVEGICNRDPKMERKLYDYCKQYFNNHYNNVFFIEDNKDDIFQESFITLWEHIEQRRIYVEEGKLYGKNGEKFSGALTTFFMGIAKLKYLEWVRHEKDAKVSDKEKECGMRKWDLEQYQSQLYDDEDEKQRKLDIISDCISKMAERCKEILNKFYYEEKTLDNIMSELPTFTSKDALKTAKYKCMERLHKTVASFYN